MESNESRTTDLQVCTFCHSYYCKLSCPSKKATVFLPTEDKNVSFLIGIQKRFDSCFYLLKKKNHDYGANEDPYRNFRNSEQLGISVEKGILLRMSDKMSRINTLLEKEGKIQESLEDTLNDLINYSAILASYISNGKHKD